MQTWSAEFQRAVVAALLDGKLGLREDTVSPEVFTEDRKEIAEAILSFRKERGAWPPRSFLPELCPAQNEEARRIIGVMPQVRDHVAAMAAAALQQEALRYLAIEIAEAADTPGDWSGLRSRLEYALNTAKPYSPPFQYGVGVADRHIEAQAAQGRFRAPYGLRSLDQASGGGLGPGEMGLILGPTKAGKSHIAVHFGVQTLLAGGRVLHLTLELMEAALARRYDRALTGLTKDEILGNLPKFVERYGEVMPNPDNLQIQFFPKRSISAHQVGDLIRKTLDVWGQPGLVIIDYASLLAPPTADARHMEVGRIHETICSFAQTERIPIWSPFQTNRLPLVSEGDVSMGHAGESYEAMQHVDMVLAINQSPSDKLKNRLRLHMEGARDTASAIAVCQCDWGLSRLTEIV